jgi:hypothetical protein
MFWNYFSFKNHHPISALVLFGLTELRFYWFKGKSFENKKPDSIYLLSGHII